MIEILDLLCVAEEILKIALLVCLVIISTRFIIKDGGCFWEFVDEEEENED